MSEPTPLPWPVTEKDAVYHERDQFVALLARVYPSGVRKTVIEGWDPERENCIYIDTPAGQLSWHVHDVEMSMFEELPPYEKPWDGHTTEQKYTRLALLRKMTEPVKDPIPDGWRMSSVAFIGEHWQCVLIRAPADGPLVHIRGMAIAYGDSTAAAICAACDDARRQDGK